MSVILITYVEPSLLLTSTFLISALQFRFLFRIYLQIEQNENWKRCRSIHYDASSSLILIFSACDSRAWQGKKKKCAEICTQLTRFMIARESSAVMSSDIFEFQDSPSSRSDNRNMRQSKFDCSIKSSIFSIFLSIHFVASI